MELELLGMNFTCFVASLRDFQLPSQTCLLPLFSQVLGYAIVAASSIVKVPQIYLIIKGRSVKGLSSTAFELEVVGYTLALAFCIYKKLPFSTYGELSFLLIQALIIVGLIYNLTPNLGVSSWVRAALYCAFAPTILSGGLNPSLLEALYACQHAIFFFSRVPQIVKNYQSKQTGQLSLLTSLMNLLGSSARLFTSIQAGAPISMVIGSSLGIITHGVLVLQIRSYGKLKSQ
ncbi:hypothetical protein GOP47_0015449 [Adiantum capillus-veneris]|uniref:Mannose-P-dolichol utilization defect 1 protein homolog n=1 Tax=Adiantum capillus-veneris TaxID=13818 RepID=A0A9D4UJN2_ADICA|nr:hypothetical protein GOP47_0015449 [Adiantum capillus-veneris]